MRIKNDLFNIKFGHLTALRISDEIKLKQTIWVCKCECGKITLVSRSHLLGGGVKSCGCKKYKIKHGHCVGKKYRSKTYRSWEAMIRRCTKKSDIKFKHYGGRGIKVRDRWLKFEHFLEDMGERPEGLTLDRINNDGNYELENCRWATYKEQNKNRRLDKTR